MALEVINVGDLPEKNKTYLIYGNPGMGKTTSISFFPGKTLLIDIDKTSKILKKRKNFKDIDVVDLDVINIWETYGKLMNDLLKTDLSKYDNIAVDNISELERCILSNLGREGKNNRVPSMGDYQRMQFFIVDSIRFLQKLKKRLILLAWETTDEWRTEDGMIYTRAYPMISQKIVNNVMGLCDVVARIYYDTKEEKRGLFLMPTNQIFAKNQVDDRRGCLVNEIILPPTNTGK